MGDIIDYKSARADKIHYDSIFLISKIISNCDHKIYGLNNLKNHIIAKKKQE